VRPQRPAPPTFDSTSAAPKRRRSLDSELRFHPNQFSNGSDIGPSSAGYGSLISGRNNYPNGSLTPPASDSLSGDVFRDAQERVKSLLYNTKKSIEVGGEKKSKGKKDKGKQKERGQSGVLHNSADPPMSVSPSNGGGGTKIGGFAMPLPTFNSAPTTPHGHARDPLPRPQSARNLVQTRPQPRSGNTSPSLNSLPTRKETPYGNPLSLFIPFVPFPAHPLKSPLICPARSIIY